MYAADGISDSASMRLLRLDRQLASVCSVEHQQLQCSYIAAHACSTLKVHAQCTQSLFFETLVFLYFVLPFVLFCPLFPFTCFAFLIRKSLHVIKNEKKLVAAIYHVI